MVLIVPVWATVLDTLLVIIICDIVDKFPIRICGD